MQNMLADEEWYECPTCLCTPGCPWKRSWHEGELKRWCCHRCSKTGGHQHNPYCESRQRLRQQHSRRTRSRSPLRRDAIQLTSPVVVKRSEAPLQRTIISCGRRGAAGKKLLRSNPRLLLPNRSYDVTEALYDSFHPPHAPDGRHEETQKRIARLEGFRNVHTWILSTMLRERYTVITCNHGRHRSVAAVELAVQDLKRIQHCTFLVEVVHIDLESPVSDLLWARLDGVV